MDERVTERAVISDHRYKGQDNQSPNGWQHVHTSTTAHCDATELLISVWRLVIDQGWISTRLLSTTAVGARCM
jgi:hypothetical protein